MQGFLTSGEHPILTVLLTVIQLFRDDALTTVAYTTIVMA